MAEKRDHIFFLELSEGISEFLLVHGLLFVSPARLLACFVVHVLHQVVVLNSTLLHSLFVVHIYLLNNASNLSDSLSRGAADSSGNNVHINFPSGGISGTLLHGCLN